jgi:hypothetical protein
MPLYIDRVLVNVGIGTEQLTADCFLQRPVEIPENFYLLNKVGAFHLRNWRVYDAWWRLMRNLQIKSQAEIQNSGYAGRIPVPVKSMIRWQTKIPESLLHSGALSKMCMSLHYLLHYRYIDRR